MRWTDRSRPDAANSGEKRDCDEMTLVDWFAGQALASTGSVNANGDVRATVARLCYDQAEAMREQRRLRERKEAERGRAP